MKVWVTSSQHHDNQWHMGSSSWLRNKALVNPILFGKDTQGTVSGDTDSVYTDYFESGIRINSECYTATVKILKQFLGRSQKHKKNFLWKHNKVDLTSYKPPKRQLRSFILLTILIPIQSITLPPTLKLKE